jgi:capsular polysaccharide biosynthesis protein
MHAPTQRSEGRYPDLARVIALARRWWLPLLAAMLAAGALAGVVGSHSGATYEAKTRLLVGPLEGDPKDLRSAGTQAQTFSQLATSQVVLDRAQRQLRDPRPAAALLPDVRVDAAESTRVLSITARARDARTAAERANAVAGALMRIVDGRRPPGAENQLQVVDAALPPDEPVGSGLAALTLMAALAALLGGLAVVLLADYFRGRVVTEDELVEVSGLTLLATVGRETRRGDAEDEESPSRLLAARVMQLAPERRRLAVAVTAAGRGPGAAHVAA